MQVHVHKMTNKTKMHSPQGKKKRLRSSCPLGKLERTERTSVLYHLSKNACPKDKQTGTHTCPTDRIPCLGRVDTMYFAPCPCPSLHLYSTPLHSQQLSTFPTPHYHPLLPIPPYSPPPSFPPYSPPRNLSTSPYSYIRLLTPPHPPPHKTPHPNQPCEMLIFSFSCRKVLEQDQSLLSTVVNRLSEKTSMLETQESQVKKLQQQLEAAQRVAMANRMLIRKLQAQVLYGNKVLVSVRSCMKTKS